MSTSGRISGAWPGGATGEVLRRRGTVGDADVAFGAERQETLEARGRVLRSLSFVAVGQQQHSRDVCPILESGNDELVDD